MSNVAVDLISATGGVELTNALGRWLETGLDVDGYRWSGPRNVLERRDGPRTEVMTFYASRKNERGHSMRVLLETLEVEDARLFEWRIDNPELTVERPESARELCA